jgi:Phage tail tube protein
MAGLRGNEAWLMFAKQASKGTPATVAALTTHKVPFAGGNIEPVGETDNLSETDANRDQGVPYKVTSGVEGSPECYVRDASIGGILLGVLGTDVVSGTMPNFTHTITPANTLPYFTFWRNLSSTLYESYRDCQISSVTISAEAGQPLTAALGIQGLVPTRLAVNPDNTNLAPLASGAVYSYNDAAVTLGGGATSLISSFELTIENNVSRQQTDDITPYDVVPGIREVSLSFDMIFESLDEYNKFHYGGAAGTTVSPNIFTTSALFTFSKGANNEIAFNLPSIAYTEFSPEPDAGGDPIVVSVSAVGVRSGSPIVTATVKNQVAAY